MTQHHLTLVAPTDVSVEDVLTPAATTLVAELTRAFGPRLRALLQARHARQLTLDAGTATLDFLNATASVREADWTVAPIPNDLKDRRVEITGPADPKMILNALGSGAQVFMADFEDSFTPTWRNLMEGQRALAAAVRGTLTHTDPQTAKRYTMPQRPAVLMARPRGLHLPERHLLMDGSPVAGAFLDAALYVLHNGRALLERGSGPYLYLPKLEGAAEASLWGDILAMVEDRAGLPRASIRVTVLIETLPAAFEMDEILHALRDRIVGLNCGRWDYIFSTIKRRRREPGFVLPDRSAVTMEQHFLRSYAQLLIRTCHRRGAFAMGGMSAFIPRKDDPAANVRALDQVRADKRREAAEGHDGTWVAHPALVEVAHEVFNRGLRGKPNQLDVARDDVHVTRSDLLRAPVGSRTEQGLRTNARVGIAYLAAWLGGRGAVPLEHLMEDAATSEISRAQIWQWLQARAEVDGKPLDAARVRRVVNEESRGTAGPLAVQARELFLRLCLAPELEEFLTLPAYDALLQNERRGGQAAEPHVNGA